MPVDSCSQGISMMAVDLGTVVSIQLLEVVQDGMQPSCRLWPLDWLPLQPWRCAAAPISHAQPQAKWLALKPAPFLTTGSD